MKSSIDLTDNELQTVNVGVAPLVIAGGLIATPFILGTLAGGADEYAGKRGHH